MKKDSNEFLVLMNYVYNFLIGVVFIGVLVTIYNLTRNYDVPYGTILLILISGLIQILVLLNIILLNKRNLDGPTEIVVGFKGKELLPQIIQKINDLFGSGLKEDDKVTMDITDGLFEQFYDNGNIKTRGNYVSGKKDGLWESFYYDGSLNVSQTFKDGIQIS